MVLFMYLALLIHHLALLADNERSDVSRVLQKVVERNRHPGTTAFAVRPKSHCRRGYAILGQLMHDGAQAHIQFDVHLKDGETHRSRFWVNDIKSLVVVAPSPAVWCIADSNR